VIIKSEMFTVTKSSQAVSHDDMKQNFDIS